MRKCLFVGDVHAPFHHAQAWDLLMRSMRSWKPDVIVVLGDFWDCAALSSHDKSPDRVLGLEHELKVVGKMLDQLDGLGAKEKHFTQGNHEQRTERYCQSRAPELHERLTTPNLLELGRRGWTYTPYRQTLKLGNMSITHDVGEAGPNATRSALNVFQGSCLTGHSHRLSYVAETNARGEAMVSASFGWLGDSQQIDYMSRSKASRLWTLGFGVGWWESKSDVVHVQPIPIQSGSFVLDGRRWTWKSPS